MSWMEHGEMKPLHRDTNRTVRQPSEAFGRLNRRALIRRGLYLGGSVAIGSSLLQACAPTQAPGAVASPTAASQIEVDTRPFILVDGQDAVTLDPASAPDVAYSHNLQRGPAEGLVQYVVKPGGAVDVGPLLAKSWKTDDNVAFTFELQQGVKFHDGTPFNGDAVKYNFDRIIKLNLTPAGRLPKISRIDVLGEQAVRFVLTGPSSDFLYPMTQMLMISPKGIQDHLADDVGRKWADDNAIGTGPYLIESRTKGTETVLTKNQDYWRGWSGNHLEKVIVRVVKEPATQKLLLERGDAHVAKNIAFTDIDALKTTARVVVENGQTPGTLHLMMRSRGPLRDVNVRKAMIHAYDYDGLIQSTFRSKADPPRGFLYSGHPFHDASVPPMKQDMTKAKDFLARSAYPNGGFSLTVLILPAFGFYQTAEAQILQDSLKQLNITVNIAPQSELATYYASVADEEKGADLWAWSGAAQTPDYNFQARRQYHSGFKRPAGVNGGYSNPRVDAILEEDMKTVDVARRRQLWLELQKILNDEVPAMFIATPHMFLTRRDELQGVPLNPYNLVPNYYEAWLIKRPG